VHYELKLFNREDTAEVGKLSLGEYCAGIPADLTDEADRCHRRFAAIDWSGDGLIRPEEVTDYFGRVLRAADTNGDGKVSLDEWLASPDASTPMGNWADGAVRRTLELRLSRSGASCARFGIFATA